MSSLKPSAQSLEPDLLRWRLLLLGWGLRRLRSWRNGEALGGGLRRDTLRGSLLLLLLLRLPLLQLLEKLLRSFDCRLAIEGTRLRLLRLLLILLLTFVLRRLILWKLLIVDVLGHVFDRLFLGLRWSGWLHLPLRHSSSLRHICL